LEIGTPSINFGLGTVRGGRGTDGVFGGNRVFGAGTLGNDVDSAMAGDVGSIDVGSIGDVESTGGGKKNLSKSSRLPRE